MNVEALVDAPAISACDAADSLLRILTAGAPDLEGVLFIEAVECTLGVQRTISRPLPARLDGTLLDALVEGDLVLHARAAIFDQAGTTPRRLAALAVAFTVRREHVDGEILPPPARWQHIGDLIAKCPEPPTLLITGSSAIKGNGDRLCVVWALQRPIEINGPVDEQFALTAVQRLARALGADVPASLSDLTIDLPGSVIREGSSDTCAECLSFEPGRVYELEDVMTALVDYCAKRGSDR